MIQSKKKSGFEAMVNTVGGLLIGFVIQLILYPMMNIPVTLEENVIITMVFFVTSFLRSYFVRRIFNK